jgi:hypothetical protein
MVDRIWPIVILLLLIALPPIDHFHPFFPEAVRSLGKSMEPWATVGAFFVILRGLQTIRTEYSRRRMELITKIFNAFSEDNLSTFYEKIRSGKA